MVTSLKNTQSNSKIVITYNIMGIVRPSEKIKFLDRLHQILITLPHLNADVICLQEVNIDCIDILQRWCNDHQYLISPLTSKETQCVTLHRGQGRAAIAELPNRYTSFSHHVVKTQFTWGTVLNCHLHFGRKYTHIREEQLKYISKNHIERNKDILVCGDFNIDFLEKNLPISVLQKWSTCIDLIDQHLKPLATVCTSNPLSKCRQSRRLDGMFLVNPKNLDHQSCQPVFDNPPLSDHIGLMTVLNF